MDVRKLCPWQIKYFIKKNTSGNKILKYIGKKLGIFKHGDGESPEYVFGVFNKHYKRVCKIMPKEKFDGLEIGPGGYFSSSIISHFYGCKKTLMVDVEKVNPKAITTYPMLMKFLEGKGFNVSELKNLNDVSQILKAVNGEYLERGMHSLSEIPSSSVDFIWSNACLEHVYLEEFYDLVCETRRVLRKGGVCSHTIDLQDHLDNSLNNLRFAPEDWETVEIKKSGFYTNRIRFKEMLQIFDKAGFNVDLVHITRWEKLPIKTQKINPYFLRNKEEDLNVSGFDVLLTIK
jgi:SAM-dependent methyltransferase